MNIDWTYWNGLPDVTVEEAAALSMGRDPKLTDTITSDEPLSRQLEFRNAIAPRRHFAAQAVRDGLLPYRTVNGQWRVTLAEFRTWGEQRAEPLTFPDEFAHPAAIKKTASDFGKLGAAATHEDDRKRKEKLIAEFLRRKGEFRSKEHAAEVLAKEKGIECAFTTARKYLRGA